MSEAKGEVLGSVVCVVCGARPVSAVFVDELKWCGGCGAHRSLRFVPGAELPAFFRELGERRSKS